MLCRVINRMREYTAAMASSYDEGRGRCSAAAHHRAPPAPSLIVSERSYDVISVRLFAVFAVLLSPGQRTGSRALSRAPEHRLSPGRGLRPASGWLLPERTPLSQLLMGALLASTNALSLGRSR